MKSKGPVAGRVAWRLLVGVMVVAAILGILVWMRGRLNNGTFHSAQPPVAAVERARAVSAKAVSLSDGRRTLEELRPLVKGANVVICVADAARADHFGCYGYPRQTTPNVDRIAESAVVFERHFCPFPLTRPSTASLFRSQHPDTHLATDMRHIISVAESGFTLAEGFARAGYQTAFFSSNLSASPSVGLGDEFEWICAPHSVSKWGKEEKPMLRQTGDEKEAVLRPEPGARRADTSLEMQPPDRLLEYVSEWLERHSEVPFFAYVHFLPPHSPYRAPEHMKQLFAGTKPPCAWQGEFEFPSKHRQKEYDTVPDLDKWVNDYDANLYWADWGVGELEQLLRQADVLDDTLFIFTSDHGEAFGEHGYLYHSDGLYDELVRVPLIVRFPGDDPLVGRISTLSQTIDLLPTLFELLEIPYPEGEVQGCSLVPLLTGESDSVREHVFARDSKESYLTRTVDSSLILEDGGRLRALYDQGDDPLQIRNIADSEPERVNELMDVLLAFTRTQKRSPFDETVLEPQPAGAPVQKQIELTDEQRRELEALGYLE